MSSSKPRACWRIAGAAFVSEAFTAPRITDDIDTTGERAGHACPQRARVDLAARRVPA
jgi:hypothetical protein